MSLDFTSEKQRMWLSLVCSFNPYLHLPDQCACSPPQLCSIVLKLAFAISHTHVNVTITISFKAFLQPNLKFSISHENMKHLSDCWRVCLNPAEVQIPLRRTFSKLCTIIHICMIHRSFPLSKMADFLQTLRAATWNCNKLFCLQVLSVNTYFFVSLDIQLGP